MNYVNKLADLLNENKLEQLNNYIVEIESNITKYKKLLKDKQDNLVEITPDEITAIKDTLIKSFNFEWEHKLYNTAVRFTTTIQHLEIQVTFYFKGSLKNKFNVGIYYLDGEDPYSIFTSTYFSKLDDAINESNTFFLHLKKSIELVCTSNEL